MTAPPEMAVFGSGGGWAEDVTVVERGVGGAAGVDPAGGGGVGEGLEGGAGDGLSGGVRREFDGRGPGDGGGEDEGVVGVEDDWGGGFRGRLVAVEDGAGEVAEAGVGCVDLLAGIGALEGGGVDLIGALRVCGAAGGEAEGEDEARGGHAWMIFADEGLEGGWFGVML